MRRPRSDSKLLNLPEDRRIEILNLMETGMSYKDLRAAVEKDFGVRCWPSTFSDFYRQEKAKQIINRRIASLSVAHEIAEEAKKRPAQFDSATVDHMSQIAFELAINPQASPKDIKTFFNMVLKARDQDLESRRVALLEEKAKQADKAKDVIESELTPEQKALRLKQIFGAS